MSSPEFAFTPFERAVLSAIGGMYPEDQPSLKGQLSTATFRSRENTGAGFFTHLTVDRDPTLVIGGRRLRDGPSAKVAGLEHGMGFILWLEDGYANCLEGYSYGNESTIGIELGTVRFELVQALG
jgi:hypothetical protein